MSETRVSEDVVKRVLKICKFSPSLRMMLLKRMNLDLTPDVVDRICKGRNTKQNSIPHYEFTPLTPISPLTFIYFLLVENEIKNNDINNIMSNIVETILSQKTNTYSFFTPPNKIDKKYVQTHLTPLIKQIPTNTLKQIKKHNTIKKYCTNEDNKQVNTCYTHITTLITNTVKTHNQTHKTHGEKHDNNHTPKTP